MAKRLEFPKGTETLIKTAPIQDMEQLYHDLKDWINKRQDQSDVLAMLDKNGNETFDCIKRPDYNV